MRGEVHDCNLSFMVRDAELHLASVPELAEILSELSSREPIFHRPEFGTARSDFEKITVDDFWEVGASGACYSRKLVLDELERRYATGHADLWETQRFSLPPARSRCLPSYPQSIAARNPQDTPLHHLAAHYRWEWKVVYHQGTIVQDM